METLTNRGFYQLNFKNCGNYTFCLEFKEDYSKIFLSS
ncbi:hypothetical protein LEP1GSC127_3819 [Leptospira kirschneri str. 200801925]|nr:hypothetical protein LEP1GSC127_3819 [Leptospira kirschneri str. 200801925]